VPENIVQPIEPIPNPPFEEERDVDEPLVVNPELDDELPEINKGWLTQLIKTIIEILYDFFKSNQ
jgi:hypothetical protein